MVLTCVKSKVAMASRITKIYATQLDSQIALEKISFKNATVKCQVPQVAWQKHMFQTLVESLCSHRPFCQMRLLKVDGIEEHAVCVIVYVGVHTLLCVRARGNIYGEGKGITYLAPKLKPFIKSII